MLEAILCPVCEKSYLSDFVFCDECDECGWQFNFAQYDDHDLSDDANPLSVNEHKLLYFLKTNEKTHDQAVDAQNRYNAKVSDLHSKYRESMGTRNVLSCEYIGEQKTILRKEFVAELKAIEAGIK